MIDFNLSTYVTSANKSEQFSILEIAILNPPRSEYFASVIEIIQFGGKASHYQHGSVLNF